MFLTLAAFLQAASYLPPEDVVGTEARKVSQIYWDCVIERAERFEKSGEAAGDVAKAALTTCDTLDQELEADIVTFQLAKAIKSGKTPDNQQISSLTAQVVESFRTTLFDRAQLRVIDIRTRRSLGEL
jgi:hypothetical protein